MTFELKALPYSEDALEPHISKDTIYYHYHKHHQGYVDKLNDALKDSESDNDSLEELIKSTDGTVYNLAAQVWNHDFYWKSLSPEGGEHPPPDVSAKLNDAFGSVDDFYQKFTEVAKGEFGSGWAWLLVAESGGLEVASTTDAVNPLSSGQQPLVTLDVWEHAYYLDYQNARPDYIEVFLKHLINWDFVAANMERVR